MRVVALALAFLLTGTPLASVLNLASGSGAEPCAMVSDAQPCIGAPCPCDHGGRSAALPSSPDSTPPESVVATMSRPWEVAVSARTEAAPAAGHPVPIDHPPCNAA